MNHEDTIVALATPAGTGALAIVRLSGPDCFEIASRAWRGKDLRAAKSHTLHLGRIVSGKGTPSEEVLDEAVAAVYRAPGSFTGEDSLEFTIHGSRWLQQAVVECLVDCGARPAEGGEFSRRAFVNGRLDLAQAEGVADLIASTSRAAQRLAMSQVKGEFSRRLQWLRDEMVELASLLELELDFSEEDVEFADRRKLVALCDRILDVTERLAASFRAGQAFKHGVSVVIAGRPNAGKSTLLNSLADDDCAIVSDIPGTTRDLIEATAEIDGVLFRFTDTAGLRDVAPDGDEIERQGIARARKRISEAHILLWLLDPSADIRRQLLEMHDTLAALDASPAHVLPVITKTATIDGEAPMTLSDVRGEESLTGAEEEILSVSAKEGIGVEDLKKTLVARATEGFNPDSELMLSNARHHVHMLQANESLTRAKAAIEKGLPPDLIAQDIREATHHIGAITGQISTDTLLHTIFDRFCIGK